MTLSEWMAVLEKDREAWGPFCDWAEEMGHPLAQGFRALSGKWPDRINGDGGAALRFKIKTGCVPTVEDQGWWWWWDFPFSPGCEFFSVLPLEVFLRLIGEEGENYKGIQFLSLQEAVVKAARAYMTTPPCPAPDLRS